MRKGFRLAGAVAALLTALVVATPVAASSPWTVFNQTGTNAYAFGYECSDNPDGTMTCDGQSIDVFEGKLHEAGEPNRPTEQTCYGEFNETFDPNSGELIDYHALFGCTFGAGTLTVDGLTTITLEPTVIDLVAIECDATECTETPDGSTVVHGVWTGVGPTFSQKGKNRFDDGSCLQVNAERSSFRGGSFEGSFEATEAQLHQGTFTFRTDCPF
jgi:hypothetical protein